MTHDHDHDHDQRPARIPMTDDLRRATDHIGRGTYIDDHDTTTTRASERAALVARTAMLNAAARAARIADKRGTVEP